MDDDIEQIVDTATEVLDVDRPFKVAAVKPVDDVGTAVPDTVLQAGIVVH